MVLNSCKVAPVSERLNMVDRRGVSCEKDAVTDTPVLIQVQDQVE
jgi:hypothetical protein